jgi:hypothetical protein
MPAVAAPAEFVAAVSWLLLKLLLAVVGAAAMMWICLMERRARYSSTQG